MDKGYNWCFTLENPSEEELSYIRQSLKVRYIIYGNNYDNNKLVTSGYLVLYNYSRLAALKKLNSRALWSKMTESHDQARSKYRSYLDVVESGNPPLTRQQQGELEKERWKNILKLAKDNNLDEIQQKYPCIYVRYYKKLEYIAEKEKNKK